MSCHIFSAFPIALFVTMGIFIARISSPKLPMTPFLIPGFYSGLSSTGTLIFWSRSYPTMSSRCSRPWRSEWANNIRMGNVSCRPRWTCSTTTTTTWVRTLTAALDHRQEEHWSSPRILATCSPCGAWVATSTRQRPCRGYSTLPGNELLVSGDSAFLFATTLSF